MLKIAIKKLKTLLNNECLRQDWIGSKLLDIPENSMVLDAGCGNQQYRAYCKHLKYYAQDFGNFKIDEKDSLTARRDSYVYGTLDYTGNIWEIDEDDSHFDAILCSEVLEHIPYPNRAIAEFSRLLRPGGRLILTVPANSLRHMDPYYFYSGFSDRYLMRILEENHFRDILIESVGSYHAWLMVETARCVRYEGLPSWLALLPAFIYHYLKQRFPSEKEVNTLCFGYHVTAVKDAREQAA